MFTGENREKTDLRRGRGFPGGSDSKASAYNAGDLGLIPGWGRSPGEGNGNPLQSTLAWKIPWTEEPGRLQSTGSQRVRHDLAQEEVELKGVELISVTMEVTVD